MSDKTITRREFVTAAAVAVPVAALLSSQQAAAQGAQKLDPKDPMAVALMYVEDAAKVDAAKAPSFKAGQSCANCLQVPAGSKGAYVPCNAFAGKLVASKGWCAAWVAKPA